MASFRAHAVPYIFLVLKPWGSKFHCRLCNLQDCHRSRPLETTISLNVEKDTHFQLKCGADADAPFVVMAFRNHDFQPALSLQRLNRMDLHPVAIPHWKKFPASSRARSRLQIELHRGGLEGYLGKTQGLAEVFFCLSCFQVALPSPWSDGHQGRRRCDWCRAHLSNFGKRWCPVSTRCGPPGENTLKLQLRHGFL